MRVNGPFVRALPGARLLRGFAWCGTAPPCSACGSRMFAFLDEGDEQVTAVCVCGRFGMVDRADSDLHAHLASRGGER